MHEDLTPVVPGEEAESLVGVIPLDLASWHVRDLTRGGANWGKRNPPAQVRLSVVGDLPRCRQLTQLFCRIDVVPAPAGTTSSATSHVGWCWDGIECEAGMSAGGLTARQQVWLPIPGTRRAEPTHRARWRIPPIKTSCDGAASYQPTLCGRFQGGTAGGRRPCTDRQHRYEAPR